jgi:hypothetical protein
MPFYEAGEHKIDHPPLFACREHKQFLRLRSSFVDDMLRSLEDIVPGNLHEIASPYVNGDTNAFKLPEHLIPPRVLLYNPDFLKGPAALPYTLIFVDKRFIGIPAAYLTADRFEGCADCANNPEFMPKPRAATPRPAPAKPQSITGSGVIRPGVGAAPAPARKPGGGSGSGIGPAIPGARPGGPPPAPHKKPPPRPQGS